MQLATVGVRILGPEGLGPSRALHSLSSSSSPLCLLTQAWRFMSQHGRIHVDVSAGWVRKSAAQVHSSGVERPSMRVLMLGFRLQMACQCWSPGVAPRVDRWHALTFGCPRPLLCLRSSSASSSLVVVTSTRPASLSFGRCRFQTFIQWVRL